MLPRPGRRRTPAATGLRDATLVVTHAELCDRHGSGSLLTKIFAREPALIVIYSIPLFGGHSAGDLAVHLPHFSEDPADVRRQVAAVLDEHEIKRIICVPFSASDPLSAIAAAELTGAPLITYVMDDQNVFTESIADELMGSLVERSSLCLAISDVLQVSYAKKFGRSFWLLPPVNSERLFAPPDHAGPEGLPVEGVIIGNVWSADVVSALRRLVKASGLRVHWFGNAGKPFVELDPGELAAEGLLLHPHLADEPLVRELRARHFGIMPSRALDPSHQHDALYRASLPSRLIYMMTTAHLPLVVLGDPDTPAGRFVERFELGATSPYEAEAFSAAVAEVTAPPARRAIGRRAASLSPSFASEPVSAWLWKSAELGRPVDRRYERLFSEAGG